MSDDIVQGWVTIEAQGRSKPPDWAVKQRYLMGLMDEGSDRLCGALHAT